MNSYPQKVHIDRPKNPVSGRSCLSRLLQFSVVLGCMAALTWAAQAVFTTESTVLQGESCPNGYFDTGETNTMQFVIKNDTDNDLTEVQVELVADGAIWSGGTVTGSNVDFVFGDKTAKVNVPKKTTLTVAFTFRVKGNCGRGNAVNPKLLVTWKEGGPELVTFSGNKLPTGGLIGEVVTSTYTFSNAGAITIHDLANADNTGKASPYPSRITASSVPNDSANPIPTGERIVDVAVTLRNVTHPTQTEVAALLVGPGGQKAVLFRGAGNPVGGFNNTTFTVNGTSGAIPLVAPIANDGTYGAADYGSGNFFGSAPAGPYNPMSSFDNVNPNGEWQLYLIDTVGTQGAVGGTVAGGWTLTLKTEKVVCCGFGANPPSITQFRDNRPKPGIAEVTISEDTVFNSDTIADGNPQNQVRSPVVNFNVSDVETTNAGDLAVSASSANPAIIQSSNIKFGGSGANRTIEFRTQPNANGETQITVVVTDPAGRSSSATFLLKVTSVNDRPVLSQIRNQAANVGTATPPLPFTVTDVETPADQLILTATSDDQATVPDSNIVLTGTGSDRNVTVLPANSGVTGDAIITIRAVDQNGGDRTMSFRVDFGTPVGSPTVSPFDAVAIDEDKSTTIGFTVRSGSSTPVDSLLITVTSGRSTLIPVSNIGITGIGTERAMTITPVLNANSVNQGGVATIEVRVTDNGNGRVSTRQFDVTVNAINDKPTLSTISSQSIAEDAATGPITFQVADVETPVNLLTQYTYVSSNPGLVPNTVSGAPESDGTAPGVIVTLGANPQDRIVRVIPTKNAFGTTTIVLGVKDQGGDGKAVETGTTSFVVQVSPVNDSPTIGKAGTTDLNKADGSALDSPPLALTINEDTGVIASDNIQYNFFTLNDILAGVAPPAPQNEIEQTVTLSISVDKPEIISEIGFDGDKNKVKSPGTSAEFRFKLRPNAYGEVTVTVTATDNGTGAQGLDNQTTVRRFKILVDAVNDLPTMAGIGNQIVPKGSAVIIPLDIKDTETARSSMGLTATSSNPNVVLPANIIFDGQKAFVTIKAEDFVGITTIRITACDRGRFDNGAAPACAPTVEFTVDSQNIALNNPPVISQVSPEASTIVEDGVAVASITVTDPDVSDIPGIRLVGTSSNEQIVPSANILFGGEGSARTMAIAPAKDGNGAVTITITAIDPKGFGSVSKTFTLTIIPVEDNPTITVTQSTDSGTKWSGGTITANEDTNPVPDPKTGSGLIEVKVHDAETPNTALTVTATSNNQSLIPDGNIQVGGTGEIRTLRISPVANRNGSATITAKVKDGAGNEVSTSFGVSIVSVNDEPTVNSLPNMAIGETSGIQTVTVTGLTAGPEEGGQVLTLTVSAKDTGSDPAVNNLITGLIITPSSIVTPGNNAAQTATINFQPIAEKSGRSTITLKIQDNGGTGNSGDDTREISFEVTISEINAPPTIQIPTPELVKTLQPGVPSTVIPVTVNDAETAPTSLVVTFSSDNPALIPNSPANLQQTGSGQSRGLIITSVANSFGSANVTATVTDTGKKDGTDVKSASQVVRVTVAAGQQPVVSTIADVTTRVNTDTDIISFTVNDAQTPAAQLVVTATSDNQSVVPNFNIQLGGSGSNRALIARPAQDRSGVANITVEARDTEGNIGRSTFKLTVLGQPPTISAIPDKLNMPQGSSTGTIPFTVSDAETFAGFLNVTPASSNPTLVPVGNVFLGGSGANRTVNVALAAGQTGVSTITLKVTDSEGQSAEETFVVGTQPSAVNQPPTITPISPITIQVGQSVPIVNFTVGDLETAVADLRVTATSSNTGLVPASGIFLGGTGAIRTLLLTPAPNQTGTSTIIVTVTDGNGASASQSFTLTVNQKPPVNVPNDLNDDGRQDIVFQDNQGFLAAWFMSGDDLISSTFFTPNNVGDAGWRAVGTADFDQDGNPDLFYQHTDGSLALWKLNNVTLTSPEFLNPAGTGSPDWFAVAVNDFNKDTKPDILFQHTDSSLALWYMNGVNLQEIAPLKPGNAGAGWSAFGSGDVNGDSNTDILFQHTDGTLAVWYLIGGNNLLLPGLLTPQDPGDPNWRGAGTIDLNGDGSVDVLLQNRSSGDVAIWYMRKEKLVLGKLLNPSNAGGTWRVVAP